MWFSSLVCTLWGPLSVLRSSRRFSNLGDMFQARTLTNSGRKLHCSHLPGSTTIILAKKLVCQLKVLQFDHLKTLCKTNKILREFGSRRARARVVKSRQDDAGTWKAPDLLAKLEISTFPAPTLSQIACARFSIPDNRPLGRSGNPIDCWSNKLIKFFSIANMKIILYKIKNWQRCAYGKKENRQELVNWWSETLNRSEIIHLPVWKTNWSSLLECY